MKLAPSILSADFACLGDEVAAIEDGGADWVHVDVMDGHFVPNLTIGAPVAAAVHRVTDLPLDVHLMIDNPDDYLEDFAEAGARVLTVHQEVCPHLHRTVQRIRALGMEPGVALNPATPVAALEEIAPELGLVLVMSVNPGFGGQSFIGGSMEKVARTRALLDRVESSAEIEVDGGVDAGNAAALRDAGATVLVAGSAVYGHAEGAAAGVRALRRALAE